MSTLLKLLLVEDNPDDAELLIHELQLGGYEVVFERVETAGAMRTALVEKTWDLIISDYSLPHFNAPEALEVLKTSALDLPFIIVSGAIGEEAAVTALKAGAHDFLIKSKYARLTHTIERELKEAETRRERKRTELQLQESEERYQSLFENMLSGYAFCQMLFNENNRPEDFIYIMVNDAFEKLTGLKDVVGKRVSEVIPGVQESNPELFETYGRVSLTGKPERFETHIEALGIWFSISVYSPKQGYFVAVFDNITESRQAEEALLQSEEQYRSLFEDSPISLWVEDFSGVKQRLDELKKNGVQDIPTYLREHPDFVIESAKQLRILDVNSAAMKVYHARQKDELLGNLADVLPAMPLEHFEHELVQIANGRLNFEREEVDQTLTGEKIHVNIRWSVAPGYESSLAKVIVSTVDITERKEAEEEIKKQLAELQRWHNATLGRETRVLDLKREVNEVLGQASQPPRYPSAESQDQKEK
jgi:PAS domain S-box-containing protein